MKKELNFKFAELQNLVTILNSNSNEARLIGGCVRDALLGREVADIDIATNLLPQDATALLKENGFKVIPTGLAHGTITAICKDEKFEITTLRRDIKCDGRWAQIEFTNRFEDDAKRRDFTINALSYCPIKKQVFDYCNGLENLANKQVIFINDPNERIQEDCLRILRFFRFSTYYAKNFDQAGLSACNNHAHLLPTLSRERINQEFDKILLAEKVLDALNLMQENVLENIFPDAEVAFLSQAITLARQLKIDLPLDYINAFLLYKNTSIHLLKFSNARKDKIKHVTNFISNEGEDVDFLLKKIWIEEKQVDVFVLLAVLTQRISLNQAQEMLKFFKATPLPQFIIDGNIIKMLGYTGKEIGNVLNYLKQTWIQKNFQITKEELLACLKKY